MIRLWCVHCAEPIDRDHSIRRYVHSDTDSVACDGSMVIGPRAMPDLDRLVADATAALDTQYWLTFVDRSDDGLSPAQIMALLDGVNPYESREFTAVEEAEHTMRCESIEQILRDLLDADLYDLLDQRDRLEELRQEIHDRDESDLITELHKVSPHSLFRYNLDIDVPDYTMTAQQRADTCAEIIRATGLGSDQRTVGRIYGLIDDASYGGHLSVLWSTRPDEAIALAEPIGWDEHGKELTQPCGTVTFTHAHLLILDKWAGSGHAIPVPTITAEWGPRRVVIDSPRIGNGYSWTEAPHPAPTRPPTPSTGPTTGAARHEQQSDGQAGVPAGGIDLGGMA